MLVRRLRAEIRNRGASSITESRDHLGHGPVIRAALRSERLPDLENLTGLGSERYSEEVFQRIHARICELRPAHTVDHALLQLRSLAHESSTIHGRFGVDSPTIRALLMYALVEARLCRFDDLEIVEIGAGIASFAATVLTLSNPRRYSIYDLPDMLAVQQGFLRQVLPPEKFAKLRFCNARELAHVEPYDLVYSTYAFSELVESAAEEYFDKIVRQARMGFMTYNHLGARFWMENLSAFELCQRLLSKEVGVESIEVRADEHYLLGAGGDSSCCNLLWKRRVPASN